MYSRSIVFIVLAAMSFAASPVEISTGGSSSGTIAERGQTITGCPELAPKGKETVAGEWLALTDSAIQTTKLFALNAKLASASAAEKYYFQNIPLRVGKTVNAQIAKRRVNTSARSEYDMTFGTHRYRFVEWGAWEFALQTLSSAGLVVVTETTGTDSTVIPKHAYVATQEVRDSYEPGTLELIRAGDFNGDGIVDLLLRYWSKEAGGLKLWLSNPQTGKHSEPLVTATEYSDC